ncbi:hypothetical protein DSC45_21505 [Streptomyces sp. YIM 130001]|uniref:hypothetical protein n=1 Tax=Streptomyces sp. YIM 130001 TaxID=2259644 RepID=UPI000E6492B0|nr:hypothetical protein [Streptomyces sp. YIM 130001]RII14268.1 hypothetical protein DSC45_21505 [Streptomyces sp. YIM 130001]
MFKAGVGFFALFGLAWWAAAVGTFEATAVVLTASVAGVAVSVALMLAAKRLLPESMGGPPPKEQRRAFGWINLAQWAVIAVVAVVCGRAGVPEYIPALIAVVVGLHFVPLAAVFGQPQLRVPGGMLMLAGAAGCGIRLADGSPETMRLVVGGLAALTLWGTAAWTVVAETRAPATEAETA